MTRREQMICGLLEGGTVMREILYHGKRIDNGEWVEGAYMPYYYSTRYGKVAAIFTNMSKSAQAAVIEDYLQRGKTGGKEYA